jgi:hypothetical protein
LTIGGYSGERRVKQELDKSRPCEMRAGISRAAVEIGGEKA